MCPSRRSVSVTGIFLPSGSNTAFLYEGLSHRFILVGMAKGVVFQDLWISVGSDKLSFTDQAYIYNAKGQSQMLPAETKNTVDSHCVCPCNCRCLTNKKWKQNRWTDPKGNPLQMNLRRELVSCFSLRRSIKLGFVVSCTEMYRCLSEQLRVSNLISVTSAVSGNLSLNGKNNFDLSFPSDFIGVMVN